MTLLVLSGQMPTQGAEPIGLFARLSDEERVIRQQILREMAPDYEALGENSGPWEGSTIVDGPAVGELVEMRVWRPLTPADLLLLDRSGFWPAGFSHGGDVFAAIVQNEPDIALLSGGSSFVRSISIWDPSPDSREAPSDWSGHLIVHHIGTETPHGSTVLGPGIYSIPASQSDLDWICSQQGVLSVEWGRRYVVANASFRADDSRRLTGCPAVWAYYQGSGITTGVLDTGVWTAHPDLTNAVISGPPDTDGHGTAVCGVIASRGDVPLGCEYNGSGVANLSSLFVLQRPEIITPTILTGLLGEFEAAGCRAINNSWGSSITEYDPLAEAVDEWVNDNEVVLVFSAGNEGDPGTITSPGTAKNCITAGAVTYIPDENGNCYLAPYSSQGPTPGDQRLKPEILAPGGDFDMESMINGVVTANAMYGGSWLDDSTSRWPGEPFYTRRVGTSMAAAHVTGAIAFCFEKYGDLVHPEDISALLVASAIPLAGNTGPASSGYATVGYGYGMLDAFHLPGVYFSEEVDRPLWVYDTMQEGAPDREWTFYLPGSIQRVSAAIAYCDVAGEGIRNDLDLTLISPSSIEYTFTLPAGVTSESPIERICLENPEYGAWEARISAESWSDPGNPFEEEKYSLVIYTYSRNPGVAVLSPADTTLYASPDSELDIPLTVENPGGYVAVGTWASIDAPAGFQGEVDIPRYMGNLVYRNAAAVDTFTLSTPTQPGTYQLMARVNAANLGIQADSVLFQVVVAYPDLVVSAPSPSISPPFEVGETVNFSVVVTNQGEGPSGPSDLTLYLETDPDSSTNPVSTFDVPPLLGGESVSSSEQVTFTYFDLGERYMVAEVDESELVEESAEDNNRSSYGPFLVEGTLAPPEDLSAESGNDGFIPLSWSPPSVSTDDRDSSRGLTGYRLYRSLSPISPDPDPLVTLNSGDTTYVDSLVSNSVTYYYWVTCLYQDPTGESDYSNMASAIPQGPSGSLSGSVQDALTGQPLKDVSLTIEEFGLDVITDDEGEYLFDNVPVGQIPLEVAHQGYITIEDTVSILEDEMTLRDYVLTRDLGEDLSIIPNPFTPNSDGINDHAYFIWPAYEDQLITVTIYSMEGVPLRTIEGIQPSWNGIDDGGGRVAGGIYVFMAWAADQRRSGVICLAR